MAVSPTLTYSVDTPSAAGAAGYLVLDDTTYGKLDTAKLAGDSVLVDVLDSGRHISLRRGSNDPSDALFHAQTGECVAELDNRTRAFDPNSNTDIRPMRAMQVSATWAATTYKLFTGFIDSWQLSYSAYVKDAVTTANAVDGTIKLVDLSVADWFAQQDTGARILRLLSDADFPVSQTDVDTGLTLMPAHIGTVSAWGAAVEACDSEMGDLYFAADGTLRFRNRDSIITESRSATSQATFGDQGSELRYHGITVSYDDKRIRNDITVVYNEDGDSAHVRDAASIATYGFKSYTLQASIADASVAQNLAAFLLRLYRAPRVRIDEIVVKPHRDPTNLWPAVLARELGDRVTVKLTPPGGGSRISREVFVRGIAHDIEPYDSHGNGDWTVTLTLQDATLFYSPFVLDTSQLDNTTQLLWF